PAPTAAPVLQPEQLSFLFEARAASAVLAACLDLGVFDRLDKGPVDATTLARDCGIREETAPALLSALASLGLVDTDHRGGFVGVTADLKWFLELLGRYDSFTDGLRHRPESPADAPPGADAAFSRTVGPLASVCRPALGKATEQLAGTGPRVLDLGAGAAPWSLALAAADPDVAVTAVDLPAVLPITRQAVAAAGREGQFHLIEDDMFRVTLDDDAFDLVILGNICHLFDESTNRRLLGRVAGWVAPGGTVAIIDFVTNERRDGPRLVALLGAELVRRVPTGQLSVQLLRQLAARNGLRADRPHRALPLPAHHPRAGPSPLMEPTAMLAAARDGFAVTVERYAQLVQDVGDTSIAIPGSEWAVRDAAVHLAGANHRCAALAGGEPSTVPTADKQFLAARARKLIAENPETDGKKLADQIREGLGPLMAVTATVPADQPIAYHAGLRPNLAELVSLYLGEYLLHGYDIATAVGEAWPIHPRYAALAVQGYRTCYSAIFNPTTATGLEATYRLDTAGTDSFFLRITDAAYEEPTTPGSVDCVISADPVTALLVMSGRLTQWAAIALGRLTFSGDRPELGPRFTDLFDFP
ncbi:MAG: methyltransferase, partial [Acidimicrobiia bacterium]